MGLLQYTSREGKGWGIGGVREGERRKGDERRREGMEEKGRSAYPDEGPLTKILNTPLALTKIQC